MSVEGSFETIFVAIWRQPPIRRTRIAEIGVQSMSAQGVWHRIKSRFANILPEVEFGARVDAMAAADVRVKLRAGIDSGTWRHKGDDVMAALAANERPVSARNRRVADSRQ